MHIAFYCKTEPNTLSILIVNLYSYNFTCSAGSSQQFIETSPVAFWLESPNKLFIGLRALQNSCLIFKLLGLDIWCSGDSTAWIL